MFVISFFILKLSLGKSETQTNLGIRIFWNTDEAPKNFLKITKIFAIKNFPVFFWGGNFC